MVQSVSLEQLRKDAVDIFHNGFACSESVIYSIRKNFELDMSVGRCIRYEYRLSLGPWRRRLPLRRCSRRHHVHRGCDVLAGANPAKPAGECHKLTNEFADAITAKFGATCWQAHRPLRRQEQSGAQVLLHRAGRVRGN